MIKLVTIDGTRYLENDEINEGDEVTILGNAHGISRLEKGIYSNERITTHKGVSIKAEAIQYAKITPAPIDYEYHTEEGQELFIAITENRYDHECMHILKATDINQACLDFQKNIQEEYFEEDDDGNGYMKIEKAHIFKVSEYQILDLKAMDDEWNKTIKENYEKEKLEEERQAYLEMKKKFEPTEEK